MNILITGGAGFMGSHFVRFMVDSYPNDRIVNYDKLTYAGDLENLKEVEGKENCTFVKGDVCDFEKLLKVLKGVDVVFHFAAESHVDNSIGNSLVFTKTNTYGTHMLLEAARLSSVKKFVHVSTDEVYGDIEEGSFKESDMLNPNNPYSASKAGAEMIARSYFKTYRMPVIIVRGNNVYGPNQYPEKVIPKFITNILEGKKVPLHGDGSNIRTFIHVLDFAEAVDTVFRKGKAGEIYNIGTSDEISNLELTRLILKKMEKDETRIDFVKDRPFNDKRYSIDLTRIKALGWKPRHTLEKEMDKLIQWYKDNKAWWKKKKTDNETA